jgi:hypothetical protein
MTSFLGFLMPFIMVGAEPAAPAAPAAPVVSEPKLEKIKPEEVAKILDKYAKPEAWKPAEPAPAPSRDQVAMSADRGREFLINNQRPEDGSFRGDFSLATGDNIEALSLAREVFAIHGLAELSARRSNEQTRRFFLTGCNRVFACNRTLSTDYALPVLRKQEFVETLVPALMVSGVAQFVSYQHALLVPEARNQMDQRIRGYLKTLGYLELPDGGWASISEVKGAKLLPGKNRNGFTDGACLLAYCRVARQPGIRNDLPNRLREIIPELITHYLIDEWRLNSISNETAEFAQFGCIALADYAETNWPDAAPTGNAAAAGSSTLAGNATLSLAWWLLNSYNVEARPGNPADFLPALMAAYRVAKARQDKVAMETLRAPIIRMLQRQMTMQLAHPLFAQSIPWELHWVRQPNEPQSGGCLNQLGSSACIRVVTTHWAVLADLDALDLFFSGK